MPRAANAVDFWRGFALVTIFINHVPGNFYDRFTHRNFSISDAAELFVFLAGWSLGLLMVSYRMAGAGDAPLALRLGGRAIQLYAAHILTTGLALALLAWVTWTTGHADILQRYSADAFFQDPARTQIGIVLLTHQLGYFDILPLYVVLILIAPGLVLIDRHARPLLLPLSLALYLATLVLRLTAPTWPAEGYWFFNPFAWQVLFVLGFALSRNEGLGYSVRRHIAGVRIAAAPVLLAGMLIVAFDLFYAPSEVPEPVLFFVNSKSFLAPMRLVQLLALIAVFSAAYPLIARLAPWLTEPLSRLGRNSLNVFCVASLLSLGGQLIRDVHPGSLAVDTAIVVGGVGLMWLTAWISEWRKRLVPPPKPPAAKGRLRPAGERLPATGSP